jgi:hypothetical protein
MRIRRPLQRPQRGPQLLQRAALADGQQPGVGGRDGLRVALRGGRGLELARDARALRRGQLDGLQLGRQGRVVRGAQALGDPAARRRELLRLREVNDGRADGLLLEKCVSGRFLLSIFSALGSDWCPVSPFSEELMYTKLMAGIIPLQAS